MKSRTVKSVPISGSDYGVGNPKTKKTSTVCKIVCSQLDFCPREAVIGLQMLDILEDFNTCCGETFEF